MAQTRDHPPLWELGNRAGTTRTWQDLFRWRQNESSASRWTSLVRKCLTASALSHSWTTARWCMDPESQHSQLHGNVCWPHCWQHISKSMVYALLIIKIFHRYHYTKNTNTHVPGPGHQLSSSSGLSSSSYYSSHFKNLDWLIDWLI